MIKRTFRKGRKSKRKQEMLDQHFEQKVEEKTKDLQFSLELKENLHAIREVLGESMDLVIRTFEMQTYDRHNVAVIYIDELVNKELVHNFVIRPLMTRELPQQHDIWESLVDNLIQAGELKQAEEFAKVIEGILSGDTVVLVDGYDKGLILGSKGWATRQVGQPRSESTVRGPREGLSETISFSLGMIRHRLKDPDLRVKNFTMGKRTKTTVGLLYIEGVADPEIVDEVTKRLEKVKLNGLLETGYIEELIQDQVWSPFPQMQHTEKPDSVVAHLLEGKVAILVDGSPHALIAPAVFSQFYYAAEDYYERYLISSFLRLIRLVSFFTALLLPALYIAFVSFHPEMIPNKLAVAMAAGRSTVPFPSIVEALLMEISVEVLREASIRLPGPIGPTIGIVGALVIGEAAVSAGLVSPAMVIVVGFTTISSYANPSYNAAISVRLLRFPMMIVASVLGLYGIIIGVLVILLHMIKLRSFGVPYMSPYAPLHVSDLKDSLVRIPWKWLKRKKKPVTYRMKQVQEKAGEQE
jgi:hypothetical protein